MNALSPSTGGKIRFNIDSGCATTAVCKNAAPEYPVKPCAEDGKKYTSPSGRDIKVEGEVQLVAKSDVKLPTIRSKKLDIRRNLMSVKRYGTCWT